MELLNGLDPELDPGVTQRFATRLEETKGLQAVYVGCLGDPTHWDSVADVPIPIRHAFDLNVELNSVSKLFCGCC